MADRVHPSEPSPPAKPTPPPPTGTYVIQIPKDQVYRVPSPETAAKYQYLTGNRHNRRRRSPCCCCLCSLLAVIAFILLLVGIAAAVFYLVVKPQSPNYSIERVSITGLNISSIGKTPVSPNFNVSVRARNPNEKIGIYYESGSSIDVLYEGLSLANGVLPVLYQPERNVTLFYVDIKGGKIRLSGDLGKKLVRDQERGSIPLRFNIRAPVRIKVGSVKTWVITVKVGCDVKVDKLSARARIVGRDCGYGVDLW